MAAQLVDWLAYAGSRKSDGSVNANGRVWAYAVGTNSPATIYEDRDALVPITQPKSLDAGGKAEIWFTQPVILRVEDASGVAQPASVPADGTGSVASAVRLINATQWPNSPTVAAALAALATSLGGTDGKTKVGTVNRTVKEELEDIGFNVMRYGAEATGNVDDSAAIQAAVNAASSAGGGVVILPPGIYRVSSQILVDSDNEVSIQGFGMGVSIIRNTEDDTPLYLVSSSRLFLRDFSIDHADGAGSSTFPAIVCDRGQSVRFERLRTEHHLVGIRIMDDGVTPTYDTVVRDCHVRFTDTATGRGLQYWNNTEASPNGSYVGYGHRVDGGRIESEGTAGTGIYVGDMGAVHVRGVTFGSMARCLLQESGGGSIRDCVKVGTVSGNEIEVGALVRPFDASGNEGFDTISLNAGAESVSGLSVADNHRPFGNYGSQVVSTVFTANAVTVTPNLALGNTVRIEITASGTANATMTLANPTNASRVKHGALMWVRVENNSGQTLVWALGAAYLGLADLADIPTSDYGLALFQWDATESAWMVWSYASY